MRWIRFGGEELAFYQRAIGSRGTVVDGSLLVRSAKNGSSFVYLFCMALLFADEAG